MKINNETMMKGVNITKWCDEGKVADSISFGNVPLPLNSSSSSSMTKNEVLIEVKASGINIDDVTLLQNSAGGGWFFHGRTPSIQNPLIGGMEYSGIVLAIGPAVKSLKIGDRVCGIQDIAVQKNPGTWAEQTMAPETDIVLIPPECDISFLQAAAIGMGAFVAGDLLKRANLSSYASKKSSKNDECIRCLIIGASGGIGTVMLQLLKKHHKEVQPLHITAVCSTSNIEKLQRLGADHVVDYKIAPFAEQLANTIEKEKFDLVFDFVGGIENENGAIKLMKKGGKFITACGPTAGVGDHIMSCSEWHGWCCGLLYRLLKSNCCCCCNKTKYEMGGGMPPLKADDFHRVVVEAGIRPEIAMEVPFEEEAIREAIRCVASRHTAGGKVVINMEKK